MTNFCLGHDYPLDQIFDESSGAWIVPGLLKSFSPSTCALLLFPSPNSLSNVEFPSSEVCLAKFQNDGQFAGNIATDLRLRSICVLWIFVEKNGMATPIRIVEKPLSFVVDPKGRYTLTIPMVPSLRPEEWSELGLSYNSVAIINNGEQRQINSEEDIDKLCQYLASASSFWLHVSRYIGDCLDVGADSNGVMLSYLDIKSSRKMVSLNSAVPTSDVVRMKIDAMPGLDVEVERRNLLPLERGIVIIRAFLLSNIALSEMVAWPIDD